MGSLQDVVIFLSVAIQQSRDVLSIPSMSHLNLPFSLYHLNCQILQLFEINKLQIIGNILRLKHFISEALI